MNAWNSNPVTLCFPPYPKCYLIEMFIHWMNEYLNSCPVSVKLIEISLTSAFEHSCGFYTGVLST